MKKEDRKEAIGLVMSLLSKTMKDFDLGIGFNKETNSLVFFDTKAYVNEKRLDGFEYKLESLVD